MALICWRFSLLRSFAKSVTIYAKSFSSLIYQLPQFLFMLFKIRNAVIQLRRSGAQIQCSALIYVYIQLYSLSLSLSLSSSSRFCSPVFVAFRASLSRFAIASFNLHAACVYAVNKAHRERPVCTHSGTLLMGPHHRREPAEH